MNSAPRLQDALPFLEIIHRPSLCALDDSEAADHQRLTDCTEPWLAQARRLTG